MSKDAEEFEAAKLRKEVCKQLLKRSEQMIPSLGITVYDLICSGASSTSSSFTDYVVRMASGNVGGELEIGLLAQRLGRRISIYTESTDGNEEFTRMSSYGYDGKGEICLLRHKSEEHYDLLLRS